MDEEQLQKPGYWAVLPAAVRYDPDLPASAKLLYAEISSLTDAAGYCFASNAYFQRLYELSERTVRRLLSELQARGYITIADGDGGQGRRRIYAGINPLAQNPDKNDREPGQKWPGYPDKNGRDNKKENNKPNNPPASPPGGERGKGRRKKAACEWEPEIFERFWNAYPRGEDKAAARYEWDEIHADRELMMTMSAALDRQKKTEEWRRGVGIPYACRWLRDRRWEDEIKHLEEPEEEDHEEGPEWI